MTKEDIDIIYEKYRLSPKLYDSIMKKNLSKRQLADVLRQGEETPFIEEVDLNLGEVKKVTINLSSKGKKHWAQNMADTLILLQSEGWFIQDIEAHANIHPCKAVVRLRLKRPKKNTTSVYRI